MPRFQWQDADIHYECIGSGKPIVLIHGFTNHGFAWVPQISDLVYAGYQVVIPDLPGHGLSKPVERTTTVSDMAACIVKLMDSLGIHQASFCGLSLGGMIVQTLLTDHAERVERAVIANSSSQFSTDASKAAVEQWKQLLLQPNGPVLRLERTWSNLVHPAFIGTPFADSVYQSWVKVLRQVEGRALAHVADGMLLFDHRQSLKTAKVPTLVIGGRHDALIPPSEAETLHQLIPGSKQVILEDGGHISNLDASASFNRVLLDFLNE